VLLGDRLLEDLKGKCVIDFGCGEGKDSIEIARCGASRVIGIDIWDAMLAAARRNAAAAGVADRCEFCTVATEQVDAIVSLDAFEHFADPAAILGVMRRLLKPGGFIAVSFGPTWYHPYGGHLFSVFPWAHLLFSERALIRWRSDIRADGATRFSEVEGGLNQMTISRFERLVRACGFEADYFEPVPIRKLAPLHNRLTREFSTAIVRCRLRPSAGGSSPSG